MGGLKIKPRVYVIAALIALFVSVGFYYSNIIFASANDPDMEWLTETELKGKTAYQVESPLEIRSSVIGGPFSRGFMRWGPKDIAQKLTIIPKDGIPEVTSPGFNKEKNEVVVFYDEDALDRYGNRPYYAAIIYGGESIQLKEIEEEYAREIGRTGVYIARLPVEYNVQHLRIHKIYVQAPPPEKTHEISRNNKVEVKYTPDCDC